MSLDPAANATFLSVGLDIGTTTTHLVISRLIIGAGEDPFGRHHVTDKEIVHRSAIYMTPMGGPPGQPPQMIDADAIRDIVLREYAAAGVRAEDILTGAVIITGETALKQNADAVLQRLAGESSSFAAAVAGANQESILAGRGSGAAEHSHRHHCCVLNVDIGGGTTNLAWFDNGQPVAAGAIRVGGRHLLRDSDSAVSRGVQPGRESARAEARGSLGGGSLAGGSIGGGSLDGGEFVGGSLGTAPYLVVSETARHVLQTSTADEHAAARWIDTCVRVCGQAIRGDFDAIPAPFIVTRPAGTPPTPDAVFFSGGVAELMAIFSGGVAELMAMFSGGVAELIAGLQRGESLINEPQASACAAPRGLKPAARLVPADTFGDTGPADASGDADPPDPFGDTGHMLARAILNADWIAGLTVHYPLEPIRATVIGAGQFSLMLSGETLWADAALLPLRNLPLVRLPSRLADLPNAAAIARAIQHEQHLHSLPADRLVAIALPDLRQADWDTVVNFARQLADAARDVDLPTPWVFTMRDNFGHLLGRTIAGQSPDRPLIVVDEIDTGQADFLDVGRPVKQFRTLIPIVAKSLIFER